MDGKLTQEYLNVSISISKVHPSTIPNDACVGDTYVYNARGGSHRNDLSYSHLLTSSYNVGTFNI